MWRIQLENLKKNTERTLDNQGELQKKTQEENCWGGIQQKYYMGGTTRDLTRNIGNTWKETG